MKNLLSIAALSIALLAPVSFATPVMAEGTPFCHSTALNGDAIDPPLCNDAVAHKDDGGNGAGQGLPSCKEAGRVHSCAI